MTLLFSRYVAMADAAFGGPDTPEVQIIPAPTAPRAVTGRRGIQFSAAPAVSEGETQSAPAQ